MGGAIATCVGEEGGDTYITGGDVDGDDEYLGDAYA